METELTNILAIDTSSKKILLGLSFGGDRLIKSEETVEQSHGQIIIKKITDLFLSSDLKKEDLTAIAVSTGPGSFTGLRIGIATAKGIAVALDIPIVGINLFELIAFKLRNRSGAVSVLVPLRKEECFVGRVQDGKYDQNDIMVVSDAKIGEAVGSDPIIGLGLSISDRFPGLANTDISGTTSYDAGDLIVLAREKLSRGCGDDLELLEPLYLQKSQAEINFELRSKTKP